MHLQPSCIIKVGGSLLGLPDLALRLRNFLADFARPRPILVCGGGAAVDLLRRWDRIYNLGEEASHWLALRILSINARVLVRILPEQLGLADCPQDCEDLWRDGRVPVYDAFHFIADVDEETENPLPRRWRITSDSIAARMAALWAAPELILLKSVTLPERMSFSEAAEAGFVDPHFPTAAHDVERVVAVNLRAEETRESVLYPVPRAASTASRAAEPEFEE
jgi:aspartokinase-like uncharacterized kinase